ncbi:hypothetical protein [Halorussus salinisoli]|uniref:hypothetical protein n=1 Tax=Halorussus salinisoli TaxID=2558242 RepID=UPI001484D391|nr:hypothetical protein [Halorussus salinisoli]
MSATFNRHGPSSGEFEEPTVAVVVAPDVVVGSSTTGFYNVGRREQRDIVSLVGSLLKSV